MDRPAPKSAIRAYLDGQADQEPLWTPWSACDSSADHDYRHNEQADYSADENRGDDQQ